MNEGTAGCGVCATRASQGAELTISSAMRHRHTTAVTTAVVVVVVVVDDDIGLRV